MHRKPLSKRQIAARDAAARRRRLRLTLAVGLAVLLTLGVGVTAFLMRDTLAAAWSHRGLLRLERREDGSLTDRRGTVSYQAAPLAYEPALTGDRYAYFEDATQDWFLCRLDDVDPTAFLAEPYTGTGTTLYCRVGTQLPSPAAETPSAIRICDSTYGNPLELHRLTDGQVIGSLMEAFRNGEAVDIPFDRYETTLDLKCVFPGWEMLYYNLIYLDCPDGGFVYERESRRCVFVGDLLKPFIV